MFDDDDEGEWLGARRGRRAGPRLFLDSADNTPANAQAWKRLSASVKAGDAEGILRGLHEARGSMRPLNNRGNPARNACARAILALREDPGAWRRLRESDWDLGRGPGDPEWQPGAVDALAYAWAACPRGVAEAAKMWREENQASKKWWSCPWISRGWEGPPELRRPFHRAAARRFEPRPEAGAPAHAGADALQNDPAEREALERALVELAKGCVEQLWSHEEQACQARLAGGLVWSRGGSEWGLRWFGADVNLEADERAPKRSPATQAGLEMVLEGLGEGSEAGDLACRKALLAAQSHGWLHEMAIGALSAWARANPGDPRGLPLAEGDWARPEALFAACEKAGVSDEALGRWIAQAGARWSAPACLDYEGSLRPAAPIWSPERHAQGEQLPGMIQWGVLEWALLSRPQSAREACCHGARLAPGVEEALAASNLRRAGKGRPPERPQALVWAEACRLAEESATRRPRASGKPSLSL